MSWAMWHFTHTVGKACLCRFNILTVGFMMPVTRNCSDIVFLRQITSPRFLSQWHGIYCKLLENFPEKLRTAQKSAHKTFKMPRNMRTEQKNFALPRKLPWKIAHCPDNCQKAWKLPRKIENCPEICPEKLIITITDYLMQMPSGKRWPWQ